MVFGRIFKADEKQQAAARLYDRIVEQARSPAFYLELGVKDDLEGRFDLVVLHLHLVVRRLSTTDAGQSAVDMAQAVFDTFFHDMDRSLRAIGVGDRSVGKKVKDMVRAFYGRTQAYEEALAAPEDGALETALARNVFAGSADPAGAGRLARYCRAAAAEVSAQPVADLVGGNVRFPALDSVS